MEDKDNEELNRINQICFNLHLNYMRKRLRDKFIVDPTPVTIQDLKGKNDVS